MNKFERYFKGAKNYNWLCNNSIELNDKYLISDSYSIINLDKKIIDKYSINVGGNDNMKTIINMFNNFESFEYIKDFQHNVDFKTLKVKDIDNLESPQIEFGNDIYSLNYKLAKNIYNIIKFDKIEVLKQSYMVVFKLINNSTNEFAYLLPQKVY